MVGGGGFVVAEVGGLELKRLWDYEMSRGYPTAIVAVADLNRAIFKEEGLGTCGFLRQR